MIIDDIKISETRIIVIIVIVDDMDDRERVISRGLTTRCEISLTYSTENITNPTSIHRTD